MGYWGYEATASDSALDYLAKVTEHLEKMWDEAKGYGQKMAIVYILTEAPVIDVTDYSGLKAKAVTFVADCMTCLDEEDIDDSGSVGDYCEDFNKKQEQIAYLQGLMEKLQEKQGTTLFEKLELTNHEKRAIERFPMVIKINPMVIKIN